MIKVYCSITNGSNFIEISIMYEIWNDKTEMIKFVMKLNIWDVLAKIKFCLIPDFSYKNYSLYLNFTLKNVLWLNVTFRMFDAVCDYSKKTIFWFFFIVIVIVLKYLNAIKYEEISRHQNHSQNDSLNELLLIDP